MGVLATLYIECFISLLGFWRRFIQTVLIGYGVLVTLYIMLYQLMGVLATLYLECFIRLLGFLRRF